MTNRDDPFDGMPDEEFEAMTLGMLRRKTSVVSLRLTNDLVDRAKAIGEREHIPYQALMRGLIEAGVTRLGRRASARRVS